MKLTLLKEAVVIIEKLTSREVIVVALSNSVFHW